MYYRKLLPFILLLALSVNVFGEAIRPINGKVYDQETGQPLAGASIIIKETKQSAISQSDGTYHINAEVGQTLIFGYLGMVSQEVTVTVNSANIDVELSIDTRQLTDVIITGALGIKRSSRELGASAQFVDSKTLNEGKTVNPLFGLASKVAGLRINMYDSKVDPAAQITLRGTRSLQRNSGIDGRNPNAPLYVVDGIPVPDIGRLNPNDIESITVLKGANAAALYGSEGVNGAIMITTKSGQRGRGSVSFSNTTTFSNAYLLPTAQTIYGQGSNGNYNPETFESWGDKFDGQMRPWGPKLPNGTQPQLLYAAPASDNRLDLFQTGINVQNDISFSGGDERSTYYLSAQQVHQTGIIPEDKNDRINLRFNGMRQFGKLKTAYNVNYINNKKDITPDGPWIGAYRMPANFDYDLIKDWQDPNSPGNLNNYFISNASWLRNPYFLIDNLRDESNQQIINGKIDLDYEFTDWFSALYRVGLYSLNDQTRNSTRKFQTNRANNTVGAVDDGSNNYQRFNSDLILKFKKDFGDFSGRLLLGQNLRTDYRKSHNLAANNLLYPDVLNPNSRVGELSGKATITEQRSLAGYGELMLGYKNYLYLTFTGRNDWVSTLSPENNSYFYPGVSASFIVGDAIEFIRNTDQISFLKVYSSWNRTGNVTLTPYQLNNSYSQANGFPFGNLEGFLPSLVNPNPNIKPEFVTSFEAGLQFGLFNNRLNFDGAYVFSDSDGQIFNAPVSTSSGYNSAYVNSGRLTNNIIELSINGDIIRNNNIRWNIGANFAYNKNVVKELYVEADTRYKANFRQSYTFVGEQYPSLWVSDYERDYKGKLSGASAEDDPIYINPKQGNVVVDANGNPIKATNNVILGTLIPPYLMGLNTQFEFKNFSVGAQFDARWGAWMYSEVVPAMYEFGTHPETAIHGRGEKAFVWPNSVVKNADGTYSPNTTPVSNSGKEFWNDQGKIQSNTAVKSDFLKLRELSISYSLPASLLANQNMVRGASFGLVGTNLFIIRHKDNDIGDPEYLYNNTDGYSSFRQIPPMRTLGFNVSVNF
jgi:TonB-linked SusC/RagA family outer membrane protein